MKFDRPDFGAVPISRAFEVFLLGIAERLDSTQPPICNDTVLPTRLSLSRLFTAFPSRLRPVPAAGDAHKTIPYTVVT